MRQGIDSSCKDWNAKSCLDYSAVYDAQAKLLVVQYCQGAAETQCTNMQITSSDMGKTWSKIQTSMAAVLGHANGVLVGPGRGLQLKSPKYHQGRLLFCGHKEDTISGRISPIWTSDDHALTFKLRSVFPRGSPTPFDKYGPDECQFAELEDGTVIYNARNNWLGHGQLEHYRLQSRSTDGGDRCCLSLLLSLLL